MTMKRLYLLIASIGLFPIALGYGVMPAEAMKFLFDLELNAPNGVHIFRAIMVLYFGSIVIWMAGFKSDKFTDFSIMHAVVFMLSLAIGRILSMGIDGMPHWLLTTYAALEIGFGVTGIALLKQQDQTS